MHPMEYLRHVAGAQGADASDLVHETAWALRGMASDPQALVLIVRRLVEKHPTCAPLWWLGANMLTALDPVARLRELMSDYNDDPTEAHLQEYLFGPAGPGGVVEALGCGIDGGVAEAMIADNSAYASYEHVALVIRRGTVLSRDLWTAMKRRASDESVANSAIVEVGQFNVIVGPNGVIAADRVVLQPECEPCPEMLVVSGL